MTRSQGKSNRRVLATTTGRAGSRTRPLGRPPFPHLSEEDQVAFRAIIRQQNLKIPDIACRLGCSRQQVYKVLQGQQGITGGRQALLDALLVTPCSLISGKGKPALVPLFEHPIIQFSGFHACPAGRPQVPRHHAKLDYLTIWAVPDVGPTDHKTDLLINDWRSKGCQVEDKRGLWHKRKWKPWAIKVSNTNEGWDFRAFSPNNKDDGFYRQMKLNMPASILDSGQASKLHSTFIAPWLKPDSRRITRIDVALDLEIPFAAVLAFRDLFPATKRTKRPAYKGNRCWTLGPAKVTTNYVGLPGSAVRWRVYDKFQEALDNGWTMQDIRQGLVPGLEHAKDWEFCTRIEPQIKPNEVEKGLGYEPKMFEVMPNVGERLHLIDLRTVPPNDPWLFFMLLAKVTSVDDVAWRVFGKNKEGRSCFRQRILSASKVWQHPHPSLMFQRPQSELQAFLDHIFGSIPLLLRWPRKMTCPGKMM